MTRTFRPSSYTCISAKNNNKEIKLPQTRPNWASLVSKFRLC
jgi:translation initiation factor RLI1